MNLGEIPVFPSKMIFLKLGKLVPVAIKLSAASSKRVLDKFIVSTF
jgi:hypothetical protein